MPTHLDWDLWLGPALQRPYHPCYHPFRWRGWWDFGTGVLGDIGCHNLSAAFKALKLGWPQSVEACSTHWNAPPEIKNETAPLASIVTYRFAAEGDRPEVLLRWYDGGMMPPLPKGIERGRNIFTGDGTLIVGDDGVLLNHRLLPESRMQQYGKPPRVLDRSPGHYQEWIDACKGGKPAGSNFVDHAGRLAAVVLMGNIAIRTGEKLDWDARATAVRQLGRGEPPAAASVPKRLEPLRRIPCRSCQPIPHERLRPGTESRHNSCRSAWRIVGRWCSTSGSA